MDSSVSHLWQWLVNASPTLGAILAAWSLGAALLNRTLWPKPAPTASRLARWSHLILVDLPSFLASRGYAGQLGPLTAPFLAASKKLGAPSSPVAPILILALLGLAVPGCAPGLADTYASMTVQERALGVAAKDLPAISQQLQHECVTAAKSAADVDACTKPIRAKVETSRQSIAATHQATITARDMVSGVKGATAIPSDLAPWVSLAVKGYADLKAVLGTLGYHLGGQ